MANAAEAPIPMRLLCRHPSPFSPPASSFAAAGASPARPPPRQRRPPRWSAWRSATRPLRCGRRWPLRSGTSRRSSTPSVAPRQDMLFAAVAKGNHISIPLNCLGNGW